MASINGYVPRGIDDVTPEFVTAALGSRYRGVEVDTVQVAELHQGTSTAARLVLNYSRNDAGLPESVFLKATFVEHAFSAANPSAAEARFYGELEPHLPAGINRPAGYFGTVDGDGHAIALVEDLTPYGVTFREVTTAATVDEVAAGLEQLASMHGAHWNSAGLGRFTWLTDISGIVVVMRYLVTPGHFADYIGRERAANLPEELTDGERVARGLETMFETDALLPQTLLHGDPHLGNTYSHTDGRPGFVDWQFVGRGPFIWDATYYLTGALDPADRAADERHLLALYRDKLRSCGVEVPSFDDVWLAHRRHMLHGFLSLLTPEDSQPEVFARTMGERFAIAAVELETLQVLT